MKKAHIVRALSILMALCLIVALPMPFATADGEEYGTETFMSETQQTGSAKETYRLKYLDTTFGTYTESPTASYLWTLGTAADPKSLVFKYDLNDATVSFTPYLQGAGSNNSTVDVFASKDGITWYQLVDGQYVGTGKNYGFIADTTTFVKSADATNAPWGTDWGYYNWSNYNEDNMNAVLAENEQKIVYLKFSYGGAPASGDDISQLQGFGISSAWDSRAPVTAGTETLMSETQQNSSAKQTYRLKYLDTTFGTYTESPTASYLWTLGTASDPKSLVFKYDLNDATVSFTPYLQGAGSNNSTVDVFASKDGVRWYQLVDGQYVGTGKNYGFIADTTTFVKSDDATNAPWGTDWGYYAWSNYSTENMTAVLTNNAQKIVYLKFSYGGAPASGDDVSQLQGFGISSAWDTTVAANTVTTGTQTMMTETQQNSSLKETYKNKYIQTAYGTPTEVTGASYLWTLGTASDPKSLVFKYDLHDATVSFTPYIQGSGSKSKVDVYASKDGATWHQLVDGQYVGNGADYGFIADTTTFVKSADATNAPWGTTWGYYNWSCYNLTAMDAVLQDNMSKTVYLKFSYGGPADDGTDVSKLQGFGISSAWDMNADAAVAGDAPSVEGAQIRDTDSALRFVFKVDDDMLADLRTTYASVEFGAVMVNDDAFTGSELVITNKTSGFGSGNPTTVVSTKHFVPEQYQSGYEGYTVYTMVIRGVNTDAKQATNVAVRAYIKATAADGTVRVIYSTDNSAHGGYVTTYDAVEAYYENLEG